ncbi:hypothetical protein TYRP_011378 [Tyrophagus putrescentiae]|nr:hypothetical protein TYRP_011378 [Tyrophagus putrescentiae]
MPSLQIGQLLSSGHGTSSSSSNIGICLSFSRQTDFHIADDSAEDHAALAPTLAGTQKISSRKAYTNTLGHQISPIFAIIR